MSASGTAQSAKLTGSTQSTGAPGPTGSDPVAGSTSATSAPAPERRRRPQNAAELTGARRKCDTGHRSARGWVRWNEYTPASRMGRVATPETRRSGDGERRSGRPESGDGGTGSRGHGKRRSRWRSNETETARRTEPADATETAGARRNRARCGGRSSVRRRASYGDGGQRKERGGGRMGAHRAAT
jgi:hypothetical protein